MVAIIIAAASGVIGALIYHYARKSAWQNEYEDALNDWNSDYYNYGDDLYHSLIYNRELPKISFDEFYSFYPLNPAKWDLHSKYLTYSKDETHHEHLFFETPKDFHLYKKFREQLEQEEKAEQARQQDLENNKTLRAILEDVQADIDATREKEKENQADAFATTLDALMRLYGNKGLDEDVKEAVKQILTCGDASSSGDQAYTMTEWFRNLGTETSCEEVP